MIGQGYTEEQKQIIKEVLEDCLTVTVERAYPRGGSTQAVRVKIGFAGETITEQEADLW